MSISKICPICGKKCKSNQIMIVHMTSHNLTLLESIYQIEDHKNLVDNNIICKECGKPIPDTMVFDYLDSNGTFEVPDFCSKRCEKIYNAKKLKSRGLDIIWDEKIKFEDIITIIRDRFSLLPYYSTHEHGRFRNLNKTVREVEVRASQQLSDLYDESFNIKHQINIPNRTKSSRRLILSLLCDTSTNQRYTYIASSGDVYFRMACVELFSNLKVEILLESDSSIHCHQKSLRPQHSNYGISSFMAVEERLKDSVLDSRVHYVGLKAHFLEDDSPYQDDEHSGSFYSENIFGKAVKVLTDLLEEDGVYEPSMKNNPKLLNSTETFRDFMQKLGR